MEQNNRTWLSSFPRSGNTLLRTVLRHCFGLYSASIYKNDLGGNTELEKYVGHIEHNSRGEVKFPPQKIPLVKTHEYPTDKNPAIYAVRDGRAACLSMLDYYKGQLTLESIITGQNKFGSWSDHLDAWCPWDRPNTLLIKYEEMVQNLAGVLQKISTFLQYPIITGQIPDRHKIAGIDGRWVNYERNKTRILPGEYEELFDQFNKEMMLKTGYYQS